METELHPVPKTVADRLREIPAGESAFIECEAALPASVRSTLARLKKDAEAGGWSFRYTTRPEGDGLRVWRLT